MKKNKIVYKSFVILLFILFENNLNAQQNNVKYYVSGKLVNYHALSRDNKMHISVAGPGKLTVTTRARFAGNSPDSLTYSIIYQIDGLKIKVVKVKNAVPDKKNVYIQSIDEKPSVSKSFTIKINPDVHNISFLMLNASPQVDLHYKFVPDSVPEWKDMSSLNDTTYINLKVAKSNIQSYYRFSSNLTQKFKVKGPRSLRVITRLEYDYTMQGSLSYRVRVKRNDTIIGTFKLSANLSTEAQYVNDKKHIPGTLEKFYLDVPPGEYYYEFSLLDKQFSALIRVSKQKK